MSRLPKNVREGYTIQECREKVNGIYAYSNPPVVVIKSYDHGRDTCGNGTAHYMAFLEWPERDTNPVLTIVESGKRREQVGYGGPHESALHALGLLGFKLDYKGPKHNDDWRGTGIYPILNWSE